MINLYVLICWEKRALIGIYTDFDKAHEIGNQYAISHNCPVNIQVYKPVI